MERRRNEWVMHVWGKKRDTLELTDVEKFHIDMLNMLHNQQKEFDKILINIALDDINDMNLFNFLKQEIGNALVNDNVEFKYCQNDKKMCEYVTFRPYVFDRIGEDVNIFYSHFKGYNTFLVIRKDSFPIRVAEISEMFWSYIMYRYSLDNIKDVNEKLNDHCTYSWFVMKYNEENTNNTYFNEYHKHMQSGDEMLKECVGDDLHKHSPGGFSWYNLKRLGDVLENKPLIKNISSEYIQKISDINKASLFTHFSEVFLMNYLKTDECYSARDFNKELKEIPCTLYTVLYPSKKIAREYIPYFEKYLIDNELI